MRILMFYQSLISCWNHGNAHFLRGVVAELLARGHEVEVCEPRAGWSVTRLVAEQGPAALAVLEAEFADLPSTRYVEAELDLDALLDGADLVLVHEWTSPALIAAIGRHRVQRGRYQLLLHDTHHRSVSAPEQLDALELDGYDGVLAFGSVIAELYRARGWAERVWTWHEAADLRRFGPRPHIEPSAELVWIGNWGDDERAAELDEFLLGPIRELRLRASVHGVRYPRAARAAVIESGAEYHGWLPNHRVPEAFARHRLTVHVPRRPYVRALPGIPTIRPFEALACGIPLISSPWNDSDGLFEAGRDYLIARDGAEMIRHIRALLSDQSLAAELAQNGRRRILEAHTCAHRVDELLGVHAALTRPARPMLGLGGAA
ncbi:MAG: glycosyltransferase [Enhygromyxa sp.]